MDNNETPINIFLDLSKAFDTIDHNILLDKLKYYGLDDIAIKLFRSYLTNRYQYVQIENAKSQLLEINTWVQAFLRDPSSDHCYLSFILMISLNPAINLIS